MLQEFHSLARQYNFETVDARQSVRLVFETLQERIRLTIEGE